MSGHALTIQGRLVRIVLLGDSHLARVQRDLRRIGENVENGALGGATVLGLQDQADRASLCDSDTVVVSIGTNDAAPRNGLPVEDFERTLGGFVGANAAGGWVIMAPPGVEESRLVTDDWTNADVAVYRAAPSPSRTRRTCSTHLQCWHHSARAPSPGMASI